MDDRSVSVLQKSVRHHNPVAFDAIRKHPVTRKIDTFPGPYPPSPPPRSTLPWTSKQRRPSASLPSCSNNQPTTHGIFTTIEPKDLPGALPSVESELMPRIVGVWGDFGALASYVHGFVGE